MFVTRKELTEKEDGPIIEKNFKKTEIFTV